MFDMEKLRFAYEDAEKLLQAMEDLKAFSKFPYGREYDAQVEFHHCSCIGPLGRKHRIPYVFVRDPAGEYDHYLWAFNWCFLRAYSEADSFVRMCWKNYGVDDDLRRTIALANGTDNPCYRSFDPDWTGNVQTVLEVVESFHHRLEQLRNCICCDKSVREQVEICVHEVNRWLSDINVNRISKQLRDERLRLTLVLSGSVCPPTMFKDEVCFESEQVIGT